MAIIALPLSIALALASRREPGTVEIYTDYCLRICYITFMEASAGYLNPIATFATIVAGLSHRKEWLWVGNSCRSDLT